jgi:hypothetical protein
MRVGIWHLMKERRRIYLKEPDLGELSQCSSFFAALLFVGLRLLR